MGHIILRLDRVMADRKMSLNDLSDKAVNERTEKETEVDFLPLVKKIMQTSGVGIKVSTGDVSSVSALLPVYFIMNDPKLCHNTPEYLPETLRLILINCESLRSIETGDQNAPGN